MPLPKKQQDDVVQPFGHFRWSLKRQSADYKKPIKCYNLLRIGDDFENFSSFKTLLKNSPQNIYLT